VRVLLASFSRFRRLLKATGPRRASRHRVCHARRGVVLFYEWKLRYLRRDDEAYIEQPADVVSGVAVALYGPARRRWNSRAAALWSSCVLRGRRYHHLAEINRAGRIGTASHRPPTRPLSLAPPLRQVVPMCWHCRTPPIPPSRAAQCPARVHALVARSNIERYDIFDDWGTIFAYTTRAPTALWRLPGRDSDVASGSKELNDTLAACVNLPQTRDRRGLAPTAGRSRLHGSTREGTAELVPRISVPPGSVECHHRHPRPTTHESRQADSVTRPTRR